MMLIHAAWQGKASKTNSNDPFDDSDKETRESKKKKASAAADEEADRVAFKKKASAAADEEADRVAFEKYKQKLQKQRTEMKKAQKEAEAAGGAGCLMDALRFPATRAAFCAKMARRGMHYDEDMLELMAEMNEELIESEVQKSQQQGTSSSSGGDKNKNKRKDKDKEKDKAAI